MVIVTMKADDFAALQRGRSQGFQLPKRALLSHRNMHEIKGVRLRVFFAA
jgi:hypothetical protein